MKILLVTNDTQLYQNLLVNFTTLGHTCVLTQMRQSSIIAALEDDIDIVLLDRDFYKFALELKNRGIKVPIVLLTVGEQIKDVLNNKLLNGVDDCVLRSADFSEILQVTIRTLERITSGQNLILSSPHITIDLDRQIVWLDGRVHLFVEYLYRVLVMLMWNLDTFVPTMTLRRYMMKSRIVNSGVRDRMKTRMAQIRKIIDNGDPISLIKTYYDGYMLMSERELFR
ncbi:MAG: response regulator transcription factor [Patescibacteria group bacterium]|nr:response regulator transcription factor [Patescibacteria group bacterium]